VTIELARSRPADADAIARVHVASWQVAYRGIVTDAVLDALDLRERAAQWDAKLAQPSRFVAIARADGEVIGFCSSQPARDADLDARAVAEITALYVEPAWFDRGVGRALLASELPRLERAGYEHLALWVLDANERARRFYHANGFAPDGTRREALRSLRFPEHRMHRALPL